MRRNEGQEAIEFVLISVLVFFAALFTIVVFGGKIANFFTDDSAVAKSSKLSNKIISSNSLPKYEPDYQTKASDPVLNNTGEMTCNSSTCSIKIGDMVLSGIPDSDNSAIQTTGSSGGTESVSSLLDQIAQYIASNPDSQLNSNLIKQLAQMGHTIAAHEVNVEALCDQYVKVGGTPDLAEQIEDYVEENLDLTLGNSVANDYNSLLSQINSLSEPQSAKDKEILNMVKFLGQEISGMTTNFIDHTLTTDDDNYTTNTVHNILGTNTGTITTFKSRIICVAGSGTDTGSTCK